MLLRERSPGAQLLHGTDAKQTIPPLIKWPGGKRALAAKIIDFVPPIYGRYFEPFFGGGAVFFSLRPRNAVIADLNADLIDCYKQIKQSPQNLLRVLKTYKNTEASYYKLRHTRPRTDVTRAARFLYLMRLSFNGIHRVNLRGEFNVPYGYKSYLTTVDESALLQTSQALQTTELRKGDFQDTTRDAIAGDLVYFDPPYTVAHSNNGFLKYNEQIFSWSDQERLAEHAKRLAQRGCFVLVSNASHWSISDLYSGAKEIKLERSSVIAASSEHRKTITESLFILGQPK